jgi:hypothetical protein
MPPDQRMPILTLLGATLGEDVEPGAVRPIDYEVVPRSGAARIGLVSDVHLGTMTEVAVLRCVNERGEKLTTVCDADHLRRLLKSGEASEPSGMPLPRRLFPVVLRGWVQVA